MDELVEIENFNFLKSSFRKKLLFKKFTESLDGQKFLNDVKISLMKFNYLEEDCKVRTADCSGRFLKSNSNCHNF
jgi:hypothetical protein